MHYKYLKIFIIIFLSLLLKSAHAEMTVEKLIFDDAKPFHLKILEVLPKEAILQIGPDNSENTIIEFMDYFCGYCKKIQPELIEIANERNDVKIVFLQHPILNESSFAISKMVIAANYQDKGLELHNAIFSSAGSLTKEKLEKAILDSGVNQTKLKSIDQRPLRRDRHDRRRLRARPRGRRPAQGNQ